MPHILPLALIMLGLTACQRDIADTPNILTPAIMLDGVIYYSQGNVLEIAPSEEPYASYITSVVSEKYLPSRNGEANIQCLDSPYILLDKEAAVYFNEKWLVFEMLDD